jgi:hypothetical protein
MKKFFKVAVFALQLIGALLFCGGLFESVDSSVQENTFAMVGGVGMVVIPTIIYKSFLEMDS